MTVRTMDEIGAEDVADGQLWAEPPETAKRPRRLWMVTTVDRANGAVSLERPDGERRAVSVGALLCDWVLAGE